MKYTNTRGGITMISVAASVAAHTALGEKSPRAEACNDADPCPIVRTQVHGIYLTSPVDAQA